jgi:hypothetical protein
MLIVFGLALAGCSGSSKPPDAFEATVRDARDEAQRLIAEETGAIESEAVGLAAETTLMGSLAQHLPSISAALADFADALEEQSAPEQFAADVERHVPALREFVALLDEELAAARAGDGERARELEQEQRRRLAELATTLSSEYVEFGFLEPYDESFASLFGTLSTDELAYLDQVTRAKDEFERRNAQFGATLGRQYSSPEALLRALAEAGAGQAFAAVQQRALALDPPPRFAGDHERWLEVLEQEVRLDRIIGEAARGGDVVAFLASNLRLSLLDLQSARDFDPTFGAALAPGSELGATLDASTKVGGTPYGQGLFSVLRSVASADPSDAIAALYDMPVPDHARLEAIRQVGPDLFDAAEDVRTAIRALEPPDEFADDHARVVGYFDEFVFYLAAIGGAAEQGDAAAVTTESERLDQSYCATVVALSEDVAPATEVYFDPRYPPCRD